MDSVKQFSFRDTVVDWTNWSACEASCGPAKQIRKRYCSNPVPIHGRNCTGPEEDIKECNLPACNCKSYTSNSLRPYKKLPYSGLFRFVFLRIQVECGKIWTRKSPNTDNLHAVNALDLKDYQE